MTKLSERRNDILRALTATVLILATDLAVYYLTKPNSSATHLIDMSIALDDYIPFVPQFVFIYILTFAFWCIAPLIIIRTGIGRFSDFFATAVISLIICGIFFLLLPACFDPVYTYFSYT